MIRREQTKKIRIGTVTIGGGSPVAIQSMTNTRTEDVEATVAQILGLEQTGCEIIRCAVPTMEAAEALEKIKKQIHIPLVADIHFDYRLAIAAIRKAAEESEGKLTQESMETAAESLDDSFDYSVDQDTLTLSEREYGDQIILIRQ